MKVKKESLIDQISKIKNPFQMILLILFHPIFWIPVSILLIIILSFMSIKAIYIPKSNNHSAHFIWEKVPINIPNTTFLTNH